MDAVITASIGGDRALADLYQWLRRESQLRGHLQPGVSTPGADELGGALASIAVALGSSGVAAALAKSLTAWLETRRSSVTLKITRAEEQIEVTATNLDGVESLINTVLGGAGESGEA